MAIRIDLPELGDGQFVEIRDPKFLAWGVQKEITAAIMDSKDASTQLDVAEKVTIALVKGGNVINEDGLAFSFPLNATSVREVPSLVIEKVSAKFAELKAQGTDRKN